MHKEYLVIYGDIDRGVDSDGRPYACVTRSVDRQMLPESLLKTLPQQIVDNKSHSATDFIIPELFDGLVSFKNKS
jgi:hypothetical protein